MIYDFGSGREKIQVTLIVRLTMLILPTSMGLVKLCSWDMRLSVISIRSMAKQRSSAYFFHPACYLEFSLQNH